MLDDLLYQNPRLYEQVFPCRNKSKLCMQVFEEHLSGPPTSVLDVGCGTGRDLFELAKVYPDCVGFDATPAMVAFAKQRYPGLNVFVGDMRSARVHRTFDAICALGGSINFALSNHDLVQTLETYRAHARPGTLLLLEPLNPGDYFGTLKVPEAFSVPYDCSTATGKATYTLSPLDQIVERTRVWNVVGSTDQITDTMKYRIIYPAELQYFLGQHGFEVVDVFETPGNVVYKTPSLYFVARFHA